MENNTLEILDDLLNRMLNGISIDESEIHEGLYLIGQEKFKNKHSERETIRFSNTNKNTFNPTRLHVVYNDWE